MAGDLAERPITRWTLFAFGAGGAALGVTSSGVNVMLLMFYHQVMRLDPALAGLALAIGLIIDGVVDPLVGRCSDRSRGALGRRHPFILGAILPLTLFYVLLWFPPFAPGETLGLFFYLLVTSAALRVSLAFFDIPANALVAEVTRQYDMRTRLSAAKVTSSWMASNLFGILMFAIWLADAPGAAPGSGLLSAQGYREAAFWLGGVILVCAAGMPLMLWRFVPYLAAVARAEPLPPRPSLGEVLGGMFRVYSERSVRALLIATIFVAVAQGVGQSLWIYIYAMFWGLVPHQLNFIQAAYLVAGIVVVLGLPRLSRGKDKKTLALWIGSFVWITDVGAIGLRLAGLAPVETPDLLVFLCAHAFLLALLLNMLLSLKMSMLSDTVDESALRTGRREEGLILAGQTFVSKISGAMGTMLAAGILSVVAFPSDAREITPEILHDLGLAYMPVILALGALSMAALLGYRISRGGHAETVARLRESGAGEAQASSTPSIACDQK